MHIPDGADEDDEAAIHAAIESMDVDDRYDGGGVMPLHSSADETIDSGARRPRTDEANMGFGGEPRSIDELDSATIGDELGDADGVVTREDERHGPGFLDSPD